MNVDFPAPLGPSKPDDVILSDVQVDTVDCADDAVVGGEDATQFASEPLTGLRQAELSDEFGGCDHARPICA